MQQHPPEPCPPGLHVVLAVEPVDKVGADFRQVRLAIAHQVLREDFGVQEEQLSVVELGPLVDGVRQGPGLPDALAQLLASVLLGEGEHGRGLLLRLAPFRLDFGHPTWDAVKDLLGAWPEEELQRLSFAEVGRPAIAARCWNLATGERSALDKLATAAPQLVSGHDGMWEPPGAVTAVPAGSDTPVTLQPQPGQPFKLGNASAFAIVDEDGTRVGEALFLRSPMLVDGQPFVELAGLKAGQELWRWHAPDAAWPQAFTLDSLFEWDVGMAAPGWLAYPWTDFAAPEVVHDQAVQALAGGALYEVQLPGVLPVYLAVQPGPLGEELSWFARGVLPEGGVLIGEKVRFVRVGEAPKGAFMRLEQRPMT